MQPCGLGWRPGSRGSRRVKGLQGAAGAAAASAARTRSRAPPRPRWRPSPSRARLRRSGRGPAACALLGGGCCDGEAAVLPEPCSLSHLRHLGLGPRRAGRCCSCSSPARRVRFPASAARNPCSLFFAGVQVSEPGLITPHPTPSASFLPWACKITIRRIHFGPNTDRPLPIALLLDPLGCPAGGGSWGGGEEGERGAVEEWGRGSLMLGRGLESG